MLRFATRPFVQLNCSKTVRGVAPWRRCRKAPVAPRGGPPTDRGILQRVAAPRNVPTADSRLRGAAGGEGKRRRHVVQAGPEWRDLRGLAGQVEPVDGGKQPAFYLHS